MTPEQILYSYFGYKKFRSNQKQIINSVISGNDTLVIMPTGGGKSLCYQVPGLYFSGTTIVISPLISLMQDQVEALTKKNISATYLNSSLSNVELKNRLENLSEYKFIYLAPERLQTNSWLKASKKLEISLIAIDEAHCISEWGHDFRPPYMEISKYVEKIKNRPPLIALTATATPTTKNEIMNFLKLNKPNVFQGSFTRTNLNLIIKEYETNFEKQLTLFKIILNHNNQSGIIYTQTRQQSDYLAELVSYYFPRQNCHSYHAGLSSETRASIQTQFINGQINLITATNAFGMGVDKANVRFVIHFGPPSSIENYYQEVGRAGRDNLTSWCYLLYHLNDLKINEQLLENNHGLQKKVKQEKLKQMIKLITNKKCLTSSLASYFGDNSEDSSQSCQCGYCTPLEIGFSKDQTQVIIHLVKLRKNISQKLRINTNQIMTDQVIAWLALLKPNKKNELLKIPGIGQGWVDRWADDIITSL